MLIISSHEFTEALRNGGVPASEAGERIYKYSEMLSKDAHPKYFLPTLGEDIIDPEDYGYFTGPMMAAWADACKDIIFVEPIPFSVEWKDDGNYVVAQYFTDEHSLPETLYFIREDDEWRIESYNTYLMRQMDGAIVKKLGDLSDCFTLEDNWLGIDYEPTYE